MSSPTKTIDLAVLLLNYNSYELTIKIVEHLRAQQSSLHILYFIVDNASPNNAYEILQKQFASCSDVIVACTPENGGYAKGNNYGLRKLKTYQPQFVLIINNDVWFDLQTVERCIARYREAERPGIVAPIQLLPNGAPARYATLKCPNFKDDVLQYLGRNRWAKPIDYQSNCSHPDLLAVDIVPGSFLLGEYALFEAIDYFSEETFLFCEEAFLSRKITRHNRQNYIILSEHYIHEHSATIKSLHNLRAQYRFLLDSQIAYAKAYYSCPTLQIPILKVLNNTYVQLLILWKKLFG